MTITKKRILLFAAVGILLAAAAGWYGSTHLFIGGVAYAKGTDIVDLQGTSITAAEYEQLRAKLPDAAILWDVPFQGGTVCSQTTELTVASLSEEDLGMLPYFPRLNTIHAEAWDDYPQLLVLKERLPNTELLYRVTIDGQEYDQDAETLTISSITDEEISLLPLLPKLSKVDATGCSDTTQIMKLREALPGCLVSYTVTIGETEFSHEETEIQLTGADPAEVLEKLAFLSNVTSVKLKKVLPDSKSLTTLTETYPHIDIRWDMEVLGITVTSEDTQADFSNIPMESVETVEKAIACFPAMETVLMCECCIDNDTMADYRERVRDDYKVVWTLHLGKMVVRSDATYFMPAKTKEYVTDEQMNLLRYCEDMICVDVGHYSIKHCEWAASMPRLKYLIIADAPLIDITPLANLKELIYLEIFLTPLTDVSPLLNLTQLEDLNLSFTWIDPEPVMKMTWLKRLWWAGFPHGPDTQEAIRQSLPNTQMMFERVSSTGFGWREGQNYYDMRDVLGMHYMVG